MRDKKCDGTCDECKLWLKKEEEKEKPPKHA